MVCPFIIASFIFSYNIYFVIDLSAAAKGLCPLETRLGTFVPKNPCSVGKYADGFFMLSTLSASCAPKESVFTPDRMKLTDDFSKDFAKKYLRHFLSSVLKNHLTPS